MILFHRSNQKFIIFIRIAKEAVMIPLLGQIIFLHPKPGLQICNIKNGRGVIRKSPITSLTMESPVVNKITCL